jgi:uncharacterized protein YaaW (UPF0174 family)
MADELIRRDSSVPAKRASYLQRVKARLGHVAKDTPVPAPTTGLAVDGRGPLPLIEEDEDLVPLLRSASNEMLAPLVDYILEKGKPSAQLGSTAAFRQNYPNHHVYADDIAAEIQKFGANTLMSHLKRGGKGVPYRDIITNVAKKLGVRRRFRSVERMEDEIVAKVLSDAYDKMTPEQQRALLDSLKISNPGPIGAPVAVGTLQAGIHAAGFAAYKGAVIVANGMANVVLGHGLAVGANAALVKGIAVFAGPVGWTLTGLLSASVVAGPAYRVCVPAVLQVALIRKQLKLQSHTPWKTILISTLLFLLLLLIVLWIRSQ